MCFDNTSAESFFVTLKTEFYNRRDWPTWAQARTEVTRRLETVYNRHRLHSSPSYQTPVEFEHHRKTIEHSFKDQVV